MRRSLQAMPFGGRPCAAPPSFTAACRAIADAAAALPAGAMRRAATPLLALLLAACGPTTVAVEGEFPRPVVEAFPVHIGVHYSPDFVGYRHEEEIPEHGEWKVDIGPINRALFDVVLDAAFARVSRTGDPAAAPVPGVEGVLVPEIVEYQFSIPEQTRNGLYEVWVKYRLRLYGADGKLVDEWPLTGYGKSPEGTFEAGSTGVIAATRVALRDAAAFMLRSFDERPPVNAWLASHRGASTAGTAQPAPTGTAP
jgi:hypothetical protein